MKNSLLTFAIALVAIIISGSTAILLAQSPSAARWLQQTNFTYDSSSKVYTIKIEWKEGLVDEQHPSSDLFNIYRSMIGHNVELENYDLVGTVNRNEIVNGIFYFTDKVPTQGAYFYYVRGYSNNISGENSPVCQAFAPTSYCVNLNGLIIDFKSFPPSIALPGVEYRYQAFAQHRSPRVQGWVRYALVEGPEDMTIDNLSGLLKWTPPAGSKGDYYVKIRATSDEDSRAESIQEWNIRIASNDEQSSILSDVFDVSEILTLTISPNPVSDYLQIQSVNESSIIEIFSALGYKVLETEYKEKIDVAGLLQGVYFVRVGNKVSKFIKM